MQREGGGHHVVKKVAQSFKTIESASIATAERSTRAIGYKICKCNLVGNACKCVQSCSKYILVAVKLVALHFCSILLSIGRPHLYDD